MDEWKAIRSRYQAQRSAARRAIAGGLGAPINLDAIPEDVVPWRKSEALALLRISIAAVLTASLAAAFLDSLVTACSVAHISAIDREISSASSFWLYRPIIGDGTDLAEHLRTILLHLVWGVGLCLAVGLAVIATWMICQAGSHFWQSRPRVLVPLVRFVVSTVCLLALLNLVLTHTPGWSGDNGLSNPNVLQIVSAYHFFDSLIFIAVCIVVLVIAAAEFWPNRRVIAAVVFSRHDWQDLSLRSAFMIGVLASLGYGIFQSGLLHLYADMYGGYLNTRTLLGTILIADLHIGFLLVIYLFALVFWVACIHALEMVAGTWRRVGHRGR
jgi:hypothetical protein